MKTNTPWDNLSAHLNKCIDCNIAPGISFALITRNQNKSLHLGYRQTIPTQIENNVDTIWDLASLTKVVATTTCILKCIEKGMFNLKTKITQIIPDFTNDDITLLHCLNHTSGLPSDIPHYKLMTLEEFNNFINTVEPICKPGTKVIYSDINFILLGRVIDACTGSFSEFANKEIFIPLEMTSTSFNPKYDSLDNFASYEHNVERGGIIRGVVHDGKSLKLGGVSGHAGLFSTVGDLSNFVSMLINNGVFKDVKVLSSSSINLLKKCTTTNLNENRSLGWLLSDSKCDMGDYYSDCTLFHTGFTGGSLYVDFTHSFALICMTNRIHPNRENKKIYQERNNIHNLAVQCILSD